MRSGRRDLLIIGGIVAGIYGLRALPWGQLVGSAPGYAEIDGLAPFRMLKASAPLSVPEPALIGLDQNSTELARRRDRAEAVRTDLCGALFGMPGAADEVPIAYFGDVRCVACRGLERDLEAILSTKDARLRLVQHELPIFGAASEFAARASVAAAAQGQRAGLRQRLVRRPIVPEEAALRAISAELGIDADRLLQDMASPAVQDALDRTRALADVFGFAGTPAMVVGRTAILGAVPAGVLERVIRDEQALGPLSC